MVLFQFLKHAEGRFRHPNRCTIDPVDRSGSIDRARYRGRAGQSACMDRHGGAGGTGLEHGDGAAHGMCACFVGRHEISRLSHNSLGSLEFPRVGRIIGTSRFA